MTFKTKKSLGQYFLNNPSMARASAEAAHIQKGDTVLEIGPGVGALTRALLDKGGRVIAVEPDHRAILKLQELFADNIESGALTLYEQDIRALRLSELGLKDESFAVVANIPYYLSGVLFRSMLSGDIKPHTLVFLVQKEVAERIARSKKESLLSLSVKAYGNPKYVRTVPRGNFTPIPGVDSAIILVEDISRRRFRTLREKWFFDVLHAGFASKRKQLAGNLRSIASREHIARAFSECKISENARGEDLPIDTWCSLAALLANAISQDCPHEKKRVE